MARIIPMIVLAPFFGRQDFIRSDENWICDWLSLPFFCPIFSYILHGPIPLDIHFIFLLGKRRSSLEVLIGFLASIPFTFCTDAGSLIDHQRGSSKFTKSQIPLTQVQTSPIGLGCSHNIMIALFYGLGGPFLFFDAIFSFL